MAKVFKTRKDATEDVRVEGAGLLGAGAKGGVPLDRAAQTMPELQATDDLGRLVVDDAGNPKPLSGAALTKAAQGFADLHGLDIVDVADDKLDGLRQEAGALPDRPPARDVSISEGERIYGDVEQVNTVPDGDPGARPTSTVTAEEAKQ